MSLQDVFYIFAIVYMVVGIIILIIIGYVLFAIKNHIQHLQDLIDTKIATITRYTDDPAGTAVELGSRVAKSAIQRVKKTIKK